MKKIRTIVFDLGGVLIDYDREACVKKFRELGFDNAEELIGPYSTAGCLLKLESGAIDREEFYKELMQSAPRPITVGQINEAMYSFMLDIPEYKLDMLTDLRNRGYLLFMLSNTNPILMSLIKEQRFTIQGKTIDDYFDQLFLSYEMKAVKPHPEIFRQMIADTGIRPEESLFIDDSAANIETGKALGFDTYLAAPHEDFRSLFSQYEPFTKD